MKKRRAPHCGHVSHFQKCLCAHERQVHVDEVGPCVERRCDCLEFRLQVGNVEVPHEDKL